MLFFSFPIISIKSDYENNDFLVHHLSPTGNNLCNFDPFRSNLYCNGHHWLPGLLKCFCFGWLCNNSQKKNEKLMFDTDLEKKKHWENSNWPETHSSFPPGKQKLL